MKRTHASLIAMALLALTLAARSDAQLTPVDGAPAFIDYQGLVFDGNGDPLAPTEPTNHEMYFRIYDASSGGTLVWSEKQIVTVNNGQFSVRLGEGEAITQAGGDSTLGGVSAEPNSTLDTVFDGDERFLGVSVSLAIGVAPAGEIVPRLAFLTSPFAFTANRATLADSVLDGAITGAKIAGNTITNDNIAGSTITASKLAPDTIGAGRIATGGVGTSEILDGTIGDADISSSRTLWNKSGNDAYYNGGNVGINNSTPEVRLNIGGTAEASLTNSGLFMIGSSTGANLAFDRDELQARNNGTVRNLYLNPEGGNVVVGESSYFQVRTDAVSINSVQDANTLTVRGTAGDTNIALFETSSGNDRLTVNDSGVLAGEPNGDHVTLSAREIQAYSGGSVGALRLNPDGGNVTFGVDANTAHVGVNNAYTNVTLNVRAGSGDTSYFRVESSSGSSRLRVTDTNIFAEGGAEFSGSGSKNFVIDHPLAPQTKTLRHAAVEGPGRMTFYHGKTKLDQHGNATVQLPDYFDALNKDVHYQLTCVGGFANVYVAEEVDDTNRFSIAGGTPGLTVCWQLSAERDDPTARLRPYVVEQDKSPEEAGTYIDPAAFNRTAAAQ